MKNTLRLLTVFATAYGKYAAAQEINPTPPNAITYNCETVFWSIDEAYKIKQWDLNDNTISGGQTILTAPFEGVSLSFGEVNNAGVFYAGGNNVFGKYEVSNGNWSSVTTVLGPSNGGGYGDHQYLMRNSELYYYNGVDFNFVTHVSPEIAGVAVDLQGYAYIVDTSYTIRIYNQGTVLQSIPIINRPPGFFSLCAYGMLFINNILYYGTRSCGFYPDTLTPILINGSTATIGTPITFSCSDCTDLASCNQNLLSVNAFQKKPVVLYPNPGSNTINIDCDDRIETLNVYTIDGRRMNADSNSDNTKMDVSGLKSGVYFIQIQAYGKKFTERFIKE